MILSGAPLPLDDVIKPFVRLFQLAAGLLGSAALAVFDQWWWMPVPLAASFVAYELFFWLRRDLPVTVELGPTIRVRDPRRKLVFDVDATRATSAWALRRRTPTHDDVRVVLCDDGGPLVALWLRVPRGLDEPFPATDADRTDRVVGNDFGSLLALAPGDRVARQRLDAPRAALHALAAAVPPAAWSTTALRVWRGAAPPLDVLLHHVGPPSAQLRLTGREIQVGDTPATPIRLALVGRSERVVAAFGPGGVEARREAAVALDLGGVVVAIRSRILAATPGADAPGPGLPRLAAGDEWLHQHPAESAALIGHLLRELHDDALPDELRDAVRAADDHWRATAAT